MHDSRARHPKLDVSIVIVSFNSSEYLDRCLSALRDSQGGLAIETLVVDNASSDGSAELVTLRHPQAKLIRNSLNLGFAKACNQAIEVAHGRYVLLLNSDAEVESGTLAEMVSFMDANPTVGVSGCRLINEDGSLQYSVRAFPSLTGELCTSLMLDRLFPENRVIGAYLKRDLRCKEPTDVDQVSGALLMVRREAIAQVGALDPRFFMYYEEVDWCLRIKAAGWRVVYVPSSRALHYGGHSADPLGAFPYVESTRSKIQYFQKHFGPASVLLVRFFSLVNLAIRGSLWVLAALLPSRIPSKGWNPSVMARVGAVILTAQPAVTD